MATVRTLFFLGIVFFFCSFIGESRSFEDRRSLLVDGGPVVIDVKTFGALADDKTDNVLVSSFSFKFKCNFLSKYMRNNVCNISSSASEISLLNLCAPETNLYNCTQRISGFQEKIIFVNFCIILCRHLGQHGWKHARTVLHQQRFCFRKEFSVLAKLCLQVHAQAQAP